MKLTFDTGALRDFARKNGPKKACWLADLAVLYICGERPSCRALAARWGASVGAVHAFVKEAGEIKAFEHKIEHSLNSEYLKISELSTVFEHSLNIEPLSPLSPFSSSPSFPPAPPITTLSSIPPISPTLNMRACEGQGPDLFQDDSQPTPPAPLPENWRYISSARRFALGNDPERIAAYKRKLMRDDLARVAQDIGMDPEQQQLFMDKWGENTPGNELLKAEYETTFNLRTRANTWMNTYRRIHKTADARTRPEDNKTVNDFWDQLVFDSEDAKKTK